MSLPTSARSPRLVRSALLAVLLCSAATGALAAGKKPDARDAAIAALTAQLQELRDQQKADQQKIEDLATQLEGIKGTATDLQASTETLKATTDDNTAKIITLSAPPPATQATVVLSGGKPAMSSTDGRFTANLRATGMFDTAYYDQKSAGPLATDLRRGSGDTTHARDLNSGTNFRRARLGIDGKVFGDFEYSFLYEFGGSGGEDAGHIQEIYATYLGFKPWRIRLGAFEPNIGLAANGSTSSMPLLERPSPAEVSRNVAAGDSRSAVQLFGNGSFGNDSFNALWFASGAVTGNVVGTVNSSASGVAQPFGEQLSYIGRVAVAPFSGSEWLVHFGAHAQYVEHTNNNGPADATGATSSSPIQFRDRPELRVDGTRLVDTGALDANHAYEWGLEAAGQFQSFYGAAEYFQYGVDRRTPQLPATKLPDPHFSGWYVEGSWILTGERRKYNVLNAAFDGPSPLYPFSLDDKTWGAFELAARYSDLDLNYHEGSEGLAMPTDGVRGGEQKIATIGLNWYVNSAIRFMFEVQDVKIDRLNPGGNSAPTGAQIGQHYNAVAVRSQIAF